MMMAFVGALDFAARAHSEQRRKDERGTPYINHPIAVARLLVEAGVTDESVLCAALLHDTVEDCGVTGLELEERFGARVAGMVLECSDDKQLSKVERKRAQVAGARSVSPGAALVKLADKLDNCGSMRAAPPRGWSAGRVEGYLRWSKEVVAALKLAEESEASKWLVARLETVFQGLEVGDLEEYYEALANVEN